MSNQQVMRVSFDLDEVLFVSPVTHKTEKELPFPWNKKYKERLRLGTPELIHRLQELGVEVWVYTSSYRSESYIRGLFGHYHVRFDGIINAQRHNREVQANHAEHLPQKLPNRYQIAMHVDDETVIASYAREYGFKAYVLYEQDDDWVEKIIARTLEIKKQKGL